MRKDPRRRIKQAVPMRGRNDEWNYKQKPPNKIEANPIIVLSTTIQQTLIQNPRKQALSLWMNNHLPHPLTQLLNWLDHIQVVSTPKNLPIIQPSTNISIRRQINEPKAIIPPLPRPRALARIPSPHPNLQITGLNHILTRMSLKIQLDEEEEEWGGERKKKKLDFTNQEQSTTIGVWKESKIRGRPRRKDNMTKAEKGRRNTTKEEN